MSDAYYSGNNQNILVPSSQLMQNYLAETPASVSGNLAVALDGEDTVAVFTITSGQNVLCLYPDSTSETGWSQEQVTGLAGVTQIAAGLSGSGQLIVFAIIDGGQEAGPTIRYAEQSPVGVDGWVWGNFTPEMGNSTNPILAVQAANYGGQLYVSYFFTAAWPTQWPDSPPYAGGIGAWSDADKTITNPFVIWNLDSFSLFPGTGGDNTPRYFSAVTPQIYTRLANGFYEVFSDRGSGANLNGEFWRTDPPQGYTLVGDYAAGDGPSGKPTYRYTQPPATAAVLAVAQVTDVTEPGLIQDPFCLATSFNPIWNSTHSGMDDHGSLWSPAAANNYVPLGHVANNSTGAGPAQAFALIRPDLAVPASIYSQIAGCSKGHPEQCNANCVYATWGGHHGIGPLAVDTIQSPPAGVASGTFYAHPDYNVPTGTAYSLLAEPVYQSVITSFNPAGTDSDTAAVGPATSSPVVVCSSAVDSNGVTQFFMILGANNQLYYLDQGGSQWVCLDSSRSYESIAACTDAGGNLEVFAIGSGDHCLYHVRTGSGGNRRCNSTRTSTRQSPRCETTTARRRRSAPRQREPSCRCFRIQRLRTGRCRRFSSRISTTSWRRTRTRRRSQSRTEIWWPRSAIR